MTRRVYKYPLAPDQTGIALPAGAQILRVDAQGAGLYLWALVDPDAATETRRVAIVGTGHDMPSGVSVRHINTFLIDGGIFVFHAFEVVA